MVRRPDPRIGRRIDDALGSATTVLNVGAGAGAYEPAGREVIAVEPSALMISQRSRDAAPAVQAAAERLPFPDGAFDAAMALFTVHHWSDAGRPARDGPRRPAGPDPDLGPGCPRSLLARARLPAGPRGLRPPPLPRGRRARRDARGRRPADQRADSLGLQRRLPRCLLASSRGLPDPALRVGISSLVALGSEAEPGLSRLAGDVETGRWHRRNAHLLELDENDVGYRLVVA